MSVIRAPKQTGHAPMSSVGDNAATSAIVVSIRLQRNACQYALVLNSARGQYRFRLQRKRTVEASKREDRGKTDKPLANRASGVELANGEVVSKDGIVAIVRVQHEHERQSAIQNTGRTVLHSGSRNQRNNAHRNRALKLPVVRAVKPVRLGVLGRVVHGTLDVRCIIRSAPRATGTLLGYAQPPGYLNGGISKARGLLVSIEVRGAVKTMSVCSLETMRHAAGAAQRTGMESTHARSRIAELHGGLNTLAQAKNSTHRHVQRLRRGNSVRGYPLERPQTG